MRERKIFLYVDGVFVKDGKILLLKRNSEPFRGCWHLVGGHVEDYESLKEALKREFKEETNLDIEVGDIIDYRIEHTYDRTKVILVLEVTSANGEIKLNNENGDYSWVEKTPSNSVCNYDPYLNKEKPLDKSP